MRSDLMDGTFDVIADQCAICANLGPVTAIHAHQFLTRSQHTALDHLSKRDAGFGAFAGGCFECRLIQTTHRGNPFRCHGAILLFAVATDPVTAQHLGDSTGCASTKEGIKHDITGLCRADQNAM